jgi:uncharacterized protein (TIGR02001 family)
VVSAVSDARYRGASVSHGRPAFDVTASLDSPSGLYGGAAASASPEAHASLNLIGLEEYVGYARRAGGGLVVDVGIANYQRWSHEADGRYGYLETETYAGVRRGDVSAYIFYSPHYYSDGVRTLYAQLEVQRTIAGPWRVFGHSGVLTPLSAPYSPYSAPRGEEVDASVGISRSFRAAKAFVAWTIGPPGRTYYAPHLGPAGQAAILGASWGF